jgi:hypothetical protein
VLWGYTPEECVEYISYTEREVIFREAVLYFLGDRSVTKGKAVTTEDKYCQACRARYQGEQDCSTCDRDIKVIEDA